MSQQHCHFQLTELKLSANLEEVVRYQRCFQEVHCCVLTPDRAELPPAQETPELCPPLCCLAAIIGGSLMRGVVPLKEDADLMDEVAAS